MKQIILLSAFVILLFSNCKKEYITQEIHYDTTVVMNNTKFNSIIVTFDERKPYQKFYVAPVSENTASGDSTTLFIQFIDVPELTSELISQSLISVYANWTGPTMAQLPFTDYTGTGYTVLPNGTYINNVAYTVVHNAYISTGKIQIRQYFTKKQDKPWEQEYLIKYSL